MWNSWSILLFTVNHAPKCSIIRAALLSSAQMHLMWSVEEKIAGSWEPSLLAQTPTWSPSIPHGQCPRKWWRVGSTGVGQIEILAGPLALFTWRESFYKAPFIHFVDNIFAASNLIKGFSLITDSALLVSCYWVAMSQLQAEPYIDYYVESKRNLAVGPSRLDCSLLATLQ